MNGSDLVGAVMDVLKQAQLMSGHAWHPLDRDSKPIGTLEGFDSLCGLEATLMLEEQLGCSFGDDSAFVSSDGKRALSVAEIAVSIAKRMAVA